MSGSGEKGAAELGRGGKPKDNHEGRWISALPNFYKINTGATYSCIEGESKASIGITIRDSNGECIEAFGELVVAESILLAQVAAANAAVNLVHERQYQNIEFETDCLLLEDILFYDDYPELKPYEIPPELADYKENAESHPPPPGGKYLFLHRTETSNCLARCCAEFAFKSGEKISFGRGGVPQPLSSGRVFDEEFKKKFEFHYNKDKRDSLAIKDETQLRRWRRKQVKKESILSLVFKFYGRFKD